MEIKAELIKPYTENESLNFIVTQNHQQGYEIRETETSLEAWGYTDEELTQQEAERIAHLSLTRGDVFRALFQARQISRVDLREMIVNNETVSIFQKELALIDFDEALNFFRGNPLIDIMGNALGLTKEQLDKFFETNNYLYLTDCTLTINATPVEATVLINEVEQNSITVPYNSSITWRVFANGYETQTGGLLNMIENTTLDVTLEEQKPTTPIVE